MTTGSPDLLETRFVGRRARLFYLAIVTGVWTLLTLGFYRFWAKTRLRRWYWSAIRPGGQPVEYTGDGSEKMAGFFMAVSLLAFWLGIVNLILMFASLAIWASPGIAYALSAAGLVPIWFFARFRARSYVLARTRWRGIRFGMAPGAWGYAMRAVLYLILTAITLGVLWPRMTFLLEKYKTDRTYFGTQRLTQSGRWQMLLPSFVAVFVIGWGCVGLAGLALTSYPAAAWAYIALVPLFLALAVVYRVTAVRLMADHKTAGGLTVRLQVSSKTVLRIVIFGAVTTVILLMFPFMFFVSTLAQLQGLGVASVPDLAQLGLMTWVFIVILVFSYFLFFVVWSAFTHVFITMPLWRHYADALTLAGVAALDHVGQRDKDAAAEAEGFAEALDFGAAI